YESKTRTVIDESLYKPHRRETIYEEVLARDPTPVLKLSGIEKSRVDRFASGTFDRRTDIVNRSLAALVCRSGHGLVLCRKEIDGGDAFEFLVKFAQLRFASLDPRSRNCPSILVLADRTIQRVKLAGELRVLLISSCGKRG